jgi:hypothetical protein
MTLVKFKNNILKKIINVYQPNYKNVIAQGFGDYLRGCFCLYQICKMYSLEFDMDLSNHPMSNFLDLKNTNIYNNIDRNNISWFSDPNYIPIHSKIFIKDSFKFHNKFISHLNSIKQENYYLFCNSFPIFNYIHDNARKEIMNKITPNLELKINMNDILSQNGLVKKQFSVIHIRTGDDYLLKNNSLNMNYIRKIIRHIEPFIRVNKKYLIISDNNYIKHFFKRYKNCIFYIKPITHLGENGDKEKYKIKNTLIDFYIMGESNYIISISPYTWGSGFSQWCSVIHKIPYKKIIL